MKQNLLQDQSSYWIDKTPDAIAIELDNNQYTYLELELSSNRVARMLIECGIEPGDRVCILTPKSFEAVSAMLGTLKAGGVYVPIDPLGPPTRALLIMKHCEPRVLITSSTLAHNLVTTGSLPENLKHIILTDTTSLDLNFPQKIYTWNSLKSFSGEKPDFIQPSENDLAYILYTSGSTGVPKGVMISHRNALAFVDWTCEEFKVTQNDRLSNHAPFHFDLSVFDLYAAFKSGSRVVLINESIARNPHQLIELITKKGITILYVVPSALVMMMEQGNLADSKPLDTVRTILFAGEIFPVKYLRRLMQIIPWATYYNLYGPTETNVCTYYKVDSLDESRIEPVPIGQPCSGDKAFIVNEAGEEVVNGDVGELCIEGPTVMLGYWSGLPLSERPTRYSTGDLVKLDSDNQLIYLGRKDFMVKVQGFRVEIGEIEAVLMAHTDIVEAVVIPLKDDLEKTYLAAAIVPNGKNLSVLGIKQYCARMIPEYMIPYKIYFYSSLPKTSTGKADRVLLKQSLEKERV
jgi:amino acid adenylation domain-containing protein